MSVAYSESRKKGNSLIVAQAQSQVHTFFDELKNGTRNYRTIASMDKQVAQEYLGRCVLELLQNAHDAQEKTRQPRQISFVLKTSPEPVLLVGNTGESFHLENFKGLCQLGQSPKDPNQSVGNKGLGFRSVLEISSAPEIWSTPPIGSDTSFMFRFDRSVSDRVAASAQELEEKGLDAQSLFDPTRSLLNWSEENLCQYYDQMKRAKLDGSDEARKFLSPYKFPLPIQDMLPEVESLLEQGHVTVIRLPLDGGSSGKLQEAIQSVKDQLRALNAQSTIFLPHVGKLAIDIDGEQCIIERVVKSDVEFSDCARSRQQRLLVRQSGLAPEIREFQVWTRALGGEDDPKHADYIRTVVEDLPNRWPEVRRVTVGVAVEKTPSPNKGLFVIFLPTEKATGTNAHINAPFHGSLDRRHINFDTPYNKFLLESVLDMCLDVVIDLVSEEPEEWRAQAVMDMLSSTAKVDGEDWCLMDTLIDRASYRGISLNDRALILCRDGWCVPSEARLMPGIPDNSPISTEQWRRHAEFAAVSTVLDERRAAVKALLTRLDGLLGPTNGEWRLTIEQMAVNVKTSEINVTWDAFLQSVVNVLPSAISSERYGASHPLANAIFLPDQDERLLSASGPIKLFFRPVQGVDDAADSTTKVPDSLKERIAFLHSDVQIHQEKQRRRTPVQKFLDDCRFVRNFGREDILREVVKPAAPQLPVAYGSKEADLCSDLLVWTFQLLGEDPRENWLSLLRQLPVACYGGWFPMDEAVFGPGWTDRLGDDVWCLVEELPEGAAAHLRETILLPPDDPRWGNAVEDKNELFARMGVVDGLRLQKASELPPFYMNENFYQLPSTAPAGISQEFWADWCEAVREKAKPYHLTDHEYTLSDIHFLPEIYHFETLSRRGRNALMYLLLAGIVHWPDGWQKANIKKCRGRSWSRPIPSPLSYWLKEFPWLSEENAIERSLSYRWLVPSAMLQGDRFRYIDPLSVDLTRKIEAASKLKEALVLLGLNIYPAENDKTGPKLLEALAAAWDTDRVPRERLNAFRAQVRHGWQHFDPLEELPEILLVMTGGQMFSTRGQDELANIYLPDDSERTQLLLDHKKYVLEMRTRDAGRMAKLFSATSIKRSSTLEERVFIDGTLWAGMIDEISPLEDTRYAWLPVPLLTIAAHGGDNPTGTETQAWRDAANRLRRIYLLECENIVVQLVDGDEIVAESERKAQLLPDNVLAVRRDVQSSYKHLTSAIQAILKRQNIFTEIRLVLSELTNQENPTHKQIEEALLELEEINVAAVADVRHQWTGNTNLLVDRIRPVLALLGISRDGLDEAATNSERLTEWLSSNLRQWPANDVLSAARKSRDDHDMGLATWRAIGDVAQLPAWNTVLSELGERYASVENCKTQEQTDEHIEAVTPLLRGLARHIAVETGKPDLFRAFEAVIQNFKGGVDWPTKWWEVPFGAVIDALRTGYAEVLGAERYLKMLECVGTVDELSDAFQERGIAIEPNPYEIARQNQERFGGTFSELYDFYRVWAELKDRESIAPELAEPPELAKLDTEAYLRQWSDIELLDQAFRVIGDNEFGDACDSCASLDEIRTQLRLDSKDVEVWHSRRRELKQEKERQRRTLDVAGKSFEAGTINFGELVEHLDSLDGPVGPRVSQDMFTSLATLSSSSRSGENGGKVNKTFNLRLSSEQRELIGIVGEKHAYQYLCQAFGGDAVTLDAWVSGIRLKVYPLVPGEPDNTNDGHGFDFRFRHRGKQLHVEVKSTKGDDQQFDLGISEIKAASRFAQERGGRWLILRVRNALSVQPECYWLPNPFEKGCKDYFRLHRGGMRVSYTRKKT